MSDNVLYISARQLAERWSIPVATLAAYRLRRTGVPFYKFGYNVRYKLTDVIAHEDAAKRVDPIGGRHA